MRIQSGKTTPPFNAIAYLRCLCLRQLLGLGGAARRGAVFHQLADDEIADCSSHQRDAGCSRAPTPKRSFRKLSPKLRAVASLAPVPLPPQPPQPHVPGVRCVCGSSEMFWSPRLTKGAAHGPHWRKGWSAAQALGGRRKKASRATETAAHIAYTDTPLVHFFVLGGARLDAYWHQSSTFHAPASALLAMPLISAPLLSEVFSKGSLSDLVATS